MPPADPPPVTNLGADLEPLETGPRPVPPGPAPRARSARGRPRWLVGGMATAAVLALAGAVTFARSGGSEGHPAPRSPGDPGGELGAAFWAWGAEESGDEPAPPRWRRGAPGPVQPRDGHIAIWTGTELVVWGGDPTGEGAPAGAAYDPEVDRWRPVAPAPFPARTQAVAVWTGFEVLVWGGREPGPAAVASGGAYDPLGDRWRTMAHSPLSARVPLAGVWTGQELVVAGGTADGRGSSTEAAAYDPALDGWRMLAPMPFAMTTAVAFWTGMEVVLVGSAPDRPGSSGDPGGRARAAAYDPAADRWRALPSPPLSPALTAVWTGDEIVAWDYELHAAGFDPAAGPLARWDRLPHLPLDFNDCDPQGTAAADAVFAEHCGQGALYRPAIREWSRVAHPRQLAAPPVWTGEELLFWVGRFVGSADGLWRYDVPPRPLGPVPPVLGAKRR